MYRIHVEKEIAVAHRLFKHSGKCENLHGHSIFVEVDIEATNVIQGGSSDGMVCDFGDIKLLIDSFDHGYLNERAGVLDLDMKEQPTAERFARLIARQLQKDIDNDYITKIRVRVHESKGQWAECEL